jgi:hypothetical protein
VSALQLLKFVIVVVSQSAGDKLHCAVRLRHALIENVNEAAQASLTYFVNAFKLLENALKRAAVRVCIHARS